MRSMTALPRKCLAVLERLRRVQAPGHDLTPEEHMAIWCEAAGVDLSLPPDDDGSRRSDGPDGPMTLALEVLRGRGLVKSPRLAFVVGQGAVELDPEGRGLAMMATPLGLAEVAEARLRALDSEVDEPASAEPGSWLDRLKMELVRRGPMYDADGRRRWTIEDLAAAVGKNSSTFRRSQKARALLDAARTAQGRVGRSESDGDYL